MEFSHMGKRPGRKLCWIFNSNESGRPWWIRKDASEDLHYKPSVIWESSFLVNFYNILIRDKKAKKNVSGTHEVTTLLFPKARLLSERPVELWWKHAPPLLCFPYFPSWVRFCIIVVMSSGYLSNHIQT